MNGIQLIVWRRGVPGSEGSPRRLGGTYLQWYKVLLGKVKRWDGRSGSVGGVGRTGCCWER